MIDVSELRCGSPPWKNCLKRPILEFYITRLSYLALSGYTEERAAMLFRCVALLLLLAPSYQGHRGESRRVNEMREGSRTSAPSSDRRIFTAICDGHDAESL
jgi:hypothetical protein